MFARTFFISKNHLQRAFHSSFEKKIGELYILRHAKSDHNVNDRCAGIYNSSKPTEDGLEKICELGESLFKSDITFDIVYVSPLDRAIITANTLLKYLPPTPSPMRINEALVERNFGGFTGMSKNEIEKMLSDDEFKKYKHDKTFLPPNITPGHKYYLSKALYGVYPDNHRAESYQCMIDKLNKFLITLKQELLNGKNILIVGHSQNLQILQMLLYRNIFEHGIEQYKIEHATLMKFIFSLQDDNQLTIKEVINVIEILTSQELIGMRA